MLSRTILLPGRARTLRRWASRTALVLLVTVIAFSDSPVRALTDNQSDALNSGVGFFNTESCDGEPSTPGNDSFGNYTLPSDTGRGGQGPAMDANGIVNGQPAAFAALAKKQTSSVYSKYYIAMRWKYATWKWDGTSSIIDQTQYDWMGNDLTRTPKPRLIIVTNNAGTSIVVAALDAGPAPWQGVDSSPNDIPKEGWTNPETGTPLGYSGYVAMLSPDAYKALGISSTPAKDGSDDLRYAWAKDQTMAPGPTTLTTPAGNGTICGTATGPGNTVFLSQRDPRWKGQIICWSDGCGSVHDEGCWATSVAMIISTLEKRYWPNEVTPMQTEGSGKPHESFYSNKLNDKYYRRGDFDKALIAVQQGALVLIHGSGAGQYGGPFYNTPTHWEVLRGVTPSGNVLLNDPWDLNDPANPSQPNPVQYAGGGTYRAHTVREWPQAAVRPYTLDFEIVTIAKP